MVTNGNVTLSTALPVTESLHELHRPCARSRRRRGQRLGARPAGGLSVPGGPGALSRSQGHSVSGFHPVF